jgi:CxxC motif-containing protein
MHLSMLRCGDILLCVWCVLMCPVYLIDDHASCHAEACVGGEMWGDQEMEACLREAQLVRVQTHQLIHHHYCSLLPCTRI